MWNARFDALQDDDALGVRDKMMRKPRPEDRAGPGRAALLLAFLSRSRPEQREAFAALVFEQVRVDRRVEGGVVELEREVVATFFRAL